MNIDLTNPPAGELSPATDPDRIVQEIVAQIDSLESAVRAHLETWLAFLVLHSTKADVIEIDSGYDVSSYATHTVRPFDLAEFNTVKDFFEEATGDTCATYVSGHGLRAERIGDAFRDESRSAIAGILREKLATAGYAPWQQDSEDELMETIEEGLFEAGWPDDWEWRDLYEPMSLQRIVQRRRAAADAIAARNEKERLASAAEAERRHKISLAVHSRFLVAVGGRTEKFLRSEANELLQVLRALAGSLGENGSDDVAIYVRSREFAPIVSKNVCNDAKKAFAAPCP